MFAETSLQELLSEISSKSPAPGGGSVAAISGSIGAALVSMVCNLSIGKKKYLDSEEELKSILREATQLKMELLGLSEKDVAAFNEVMASFKIEDEDKKKVNVQVAYKNAANVPLEVAKKCIRVMELAKITASKGNQNAVTDSGVGALMAHSGFTGAVFNVKVNLRYIEDEAFKGVIKSELKVLEKNAQELLSFTTIIVEDAF